MSPGNATIVAMAAVHSPRPPSSKTLLLAALLAGPVAVLDAVADEGELATLVRLDGRALVDSTDRSRDASEGMRLRSGDRVSTVGGGRALLEFDDGCRYQIEAGTVLTIEMPSPCCLGADDTDDQDESVARLEEIDGEALVNDGSRYRPGTVGMRLKVGHRVIVLEGGRAVIRYDDGCRDEVEDDEILTIDDSSPCCVAGILPPAAVSAGAGQAWIPPAAAVVTGILGAVLDTGTDDDRRPPPISR